MAVYKMKRNKPVQESVQSQEDSVLFEEIQEPEAKSQAIISRTKNRSLDAYVGSGKKARRSKENGGSMVDAVYNKRETAGENVSNETDRLLWEAFADDKQAKKERKRKQKEASAREKLLHKEQKKREKTLRKQGLSDWETDEDVFDSVESLYTAEELVLSMKEEALAQEEERSEEAPGASVLDRGFFESLLAGEEVRELPMEESACEQEGVQEGEQEEALVKEEPVAEEDSEAEIAQEPQREQEAPAEEEAAQEAREEVPASDAAEALDEDVNIADSEETRELTGEEIYRRIYGEDPKAAERTREFDLSGVDPETVRKILEKEATAGFELEMDSGKPLTAEDLYGDAPLDEEISLRGVKNKEEEFTRSDTAEEMKEGIKDKSAKMLAGAIWTFLLTVVSLYFSAVCFTDIPRPVFLEPGKYGIVLLLVDLQLLIVSGVLIWNTIASGFAALLRGKANADSVTAVGMSVTLLYQLCLLLFSAGEQKLMLFSAVGCFLAFLSCVQRFLDERRNYRAFRVVSSPKEKFVARRLGRDSSEYEALKEHLPEDPDIFTIEKTKFAENYFARSRENGQVSTAYNVAVWMVLAVALAFGFYNLSGGVMQAVKSITVVTLMGLPACSLFAVALPLSKLSGKCAANESAVIGMAAMEEYSTASVLSFNDTELFPAKKIRISSFRAYGNYPIDRSILYAAMIFKKVGGPLSDVFSAALSGSYGALDRKFDILENTGDGICAKIDGREVFVGNKDYMLSYDFGYVNDDIDEPFENSVGRIMYMAVGDGIAAKFYIKYAVNRKFERVMRRLHKAGICISVKTCDPNLDNELIKCIMKNREYPVCVLKTAGASTEHPVPDSADSGIVCTSSILNVLRAFLDCDKAKRSVGTNLLVKFISLMVGLFVSVLLCFMGRMDSITTLFIIGYQLLWLAAVIVPSLTE